jgi:hypothetical protein
MELYKRWQDAPERLATRTALRNDGLEPAPGQAAAAQISAEYGLIDLFDRDQAVPRVPDDWVLIAAGDAYRTRLAKATPGAIEEGRNTRYGWKVIGYYVPPERQVEIEQALADTAARRQAQRQSSQQARQKKEATYQDDFVAELRRQYPSMPEADLQAIVQRATEVGSGAVGRATRLELEEKVRLATIAHARHQHTQYTRLLLRGVPNGEAREKIRATLERVLRRWSRPGPGG